MATITRTVRSSELSRNSREVFEAADQGPVLITRRDGDSLVLTKASQVEHDRRGLELATAVVAASLAPGDQPFVERLRQPFPWLALLSLADQEAFSVEVVDVARACAAISRFDRLLLTLHSWKATAEEVAAGHLADDELEWLGAAEPVVDSSAKMPVEALHSTAGEGYILPSQGKNVAGGKEFMRAMLSKEAAVNFAKTTFSSTIVKDTIPEDGFGSTALVSQVKLLEAAGENVFSWQFVDLYGTNTDMLVLWNTFMQGGSSVAELTKGLQGITDRVANDDAIKKVEIK